MTKPHKTPEETHGIEIEESCIKQFEAYEPFGDGWVKEIMKLKKEDIITHLLKPVLIKNNAFQTCLVDVKNQFDPVESDLSIYQRDTYRGVIEVLKKYPF